VNNQTVTWYGADEVVKLILNVLERIKNISMVKF
jgi:hypothetical protein